ncbi:hypothetical protein COLO4_07400 [Corchorus olitorius]|uniref:Uncharacterized protein n=1 Tax=Corchorus olitorius TaxID=93759 RepID=A0A1R3KK55_9ROSI|nr:hypothetical protein COLO4_07400 [Corchorus olitorius]
MSKEREERLDRVFFFLQRKFETPPRAKCLNLLARKRDKDPVGSEASHEVIIRVKKIVSWQG